MATDYGLALSTSMQPEEALRLMVEQFHFNWDSDTLMGPALWISAQVPPSGWKTMIEEAFHFRPDLGVVFRLDPNSDEYEEGNRVMLRATMLLLEHSRDAVLLFNGEYIVLQRLGGQLVLNADYGGWTDGFKLEPEIQLPHEMRSLPSPLL